MDFCKKCGSIMVPVKKRKLTYIKCRKCGYEIKKNIRVMKIEEKKKPVREIVVLEKDESPLPTTERECPKCENREAYWWLQQTRAADEPPTQFFRCRKCNHTWREYK
jgi:DNA-directed RNA polymerase subunit M